MSDSMDPKRLRMQLYGCCGKVTFLKPDSSLTPSQIFSLGVPRSCTSEHTQNHVIQCWKTNMHQTVNHHTSTISVTAPNPYTGAKPFIHQRNWPQLTTYITHSMKCWLRKQTHNNKKGTQQEAPDPSPPAPPPQLSPPPQPIHWC